MMRLRSFLMILALAASLAGCQDAGIQTEGRKEIVTETKSGGELDMLALRPAYVRIRVGEETGFTLRAWTNGGGGEGEDVSAESWTSESPATASFEGNGRVRALALGETLIRARYKGEEALARVVVVPASIDPSPATGADPEPDPVPGDDPPPDDPPCDDPPPDDDPPADDVCDKTAPGTPFADRVASHAVGSGGGFHEELLPGIVLGAPKGGGRFLGSLDVFSLGVGGEIILEFTDQVAVDCEGPDFIVFENAFQVGTNPDETFAEPGVVSVSEDGKTWVDFPCNLVSAPYAGCAGVHPTLANPNTNDIDPTDPETAGGDAFDLADVGLKKVRFVKIQDSGLGLGPIGPGTRGFDLDAIAIVNGAAP